MYCIECEILVSNLMFGTFHIIRKYGIAQFTDCRGPFATCPPPEMEPDWELHVVEPSLAELKRMEISGLELAAQFVQ